MDQGYAVFFANLISIENVNNPILLSFFIVLKKLPKRGGGAHPLYKSAQYPEERSLPGDCPRRQGEGGGREGVKRNRLRLRWSLAVLLSRNPSLIQFRVQGEEKQKEEKEKKENFLHHLLSDHLRLSMATLSRRRVVDLDGEE